MGIIRQTRTDARSLSPAHQHLEEHLQVMSSDGTYSIVINVCCGPLTLDPCLFSTCCYGTYCLRSFRCTSPHGPSCEHRCPGDSSQHARLFSSVTPTPLHPATEGWSRLFPPQSRLPHPEPREGSGALLFCTERLDMTRRTSLQAVPCAVTHKGCFGPKGSDKQTHW